MLCKVEPEAPALGTTCERGDKGAVGLADVSTSIARFLIELVIELIL